MGMRDFPRKTLFAPGLLNRRAGFSSMLAPWPTLPASAEARADAGSVGHGAAESRTLISRQADPSRHRRSTVAPREKGPRSDPLPRAGHRAIPGLLPSQAARPAAVRAAAPGPRRAG